MMIIYKLINTLAESQSPSLTTISPNHLARVGFKTKLIIQ